MARQQQVRPESGRLDKASSVKLPEDTLPVGLLPPDFEPEYVAGVVEPFLLSGIYLGETPPLPMIDLALSKEKAIPIQPWTARAGHPDGTAAVRRHRPPTMPGEALVMR